MIRLYTCMTAEHDLWLLCLAVVVCVSACLTASFIIDRVEKTVKTLSAVWLTVGAIVTGFGIWATHFIAMLAYDIGISFGFDLPQTFLSLLIVMGFCLPAYALIAKTQGILRTIGALILGLGISAMHYSGMRGFVPAGVMVWDWAYIHASLAAGIAFSLLAVWMRATAPSMGRLIGSGLALALAICLLHFLGMSALTIVPHAGTPGAYLGMPPAFLAGPIGVIALLVLLATLGAILVDKHLDKRKREEASRLRAQIEATKESERRAQDYARRAQEANRLKSEFLANMSHEIRTPLNGILGMAQLLEYTPLSDDQRGSLDIIRSSGDALLGLINDVLDISKIESGLLDINLREFDLDGLMRQARDTVAGTALHKRLDIRHERRFGGPAKYVGDGKRLKQVLINLAGNAVKFTEEGQVTLSVERISEGLLKFSVTDTGPGIPEAQHEDIFKRFTQGDGSATRRHGGTGLGLAISKDLVELMGGTIGVESAPGQGATFWFAVPTQAVGRMRTGQDTPAPAPASVRPRGSHTPAGGCRVLLAEDNVFNRRMVIDALELFGIIEVAVAETGREAIDHLDAGPFDLVLMDINMPVMSGDEAIRRIRASGRDYAAIPIIVLTANAMSGDRESYLAMGATDYLAKPIDIGVLKEVVTRYSGDPPMESAVA